MMFGLESRSSRDFIAHQVTELALGLTPPGGANSGAHFDHVMNPRLGLRQLLGCDWLGIWTRPKLGILHILVVLFGCWIVVTSVIYIVTMVIEFAL